MFDLDVQVMSAVSDVSDGGDLSGYTSSCFCTIASCRP
ncbi:FDLD family class I lanthipeptide [Tumebacillus amylolyticus]